jgi:hypothetical protein
VFAWSRVELPLPFERVVEAIRAGPRNWIPALDEDPAGRLTAIVAVSGWLQRKVVLGLGRVDAGDGWLVQPISWRAAEADVLFPVFAGELQGARLPDARTELALVGSYEPPLGPVGDLVDRVVMHRVARQALAGFLARAGERIAPATGKQAVAVP